MGVPVRGSAWCPAHHPAYRERRRRGASKGGKARGAGEVAGVRKAIRQTIEEVRVGRLDKGAGATLAQLYNVLLRSLEVERRVRETDELQERIEAFRGSWRRRVRGGRGALRGRVGSL